MIAALFVAPQGCYFGARGVDPWDEVRDARLYRGWRPVDRQLALFEPARAINDR